MGTHQQVFADKAGSTPARSQRLGETRGGLIP